MLIYNSHKDNVAAAAAAAATTAAAAAITAAATTSAAAAAASVVELAAGDVGVSDICQQKLPQKQKFSG